MSSAKKVKSGSKTRGGKRARLETIDDLPPEMLMEILKCLPTTSLFASCSLVNRKWNEISSSVLRKRTATLLKFFLSPSGSFLLSDIPNKFDGPIEKEEYQYGDECEAEQKSLQQFLDCYKSSKNFPFARFSFKDFYNGGDDLKTFMTGIGSKILSIKINPPENKKHVELLRESLTKHCPDLQELIFDDFQYATQDKKTYSGNLKLFPEKHEGKMSLLPSLKSLSLSNKYKKYLGVVQDILRAATSLKTIRGDWEDCYCSWNYSYIQAEDVEQLSEFGKLHLIKFANFKGDEVFGHWRKYPGQIMRLSKIQIEAENVNINTLVEYSKDCLTELVVLRSGRIIPDVNWSVVPNLQKLSLPANANPRLFLPQGENIILPNLKELEIEGTGDSEENSKSPLVPFPNVKILKLKFYSYAPEFVSDICIMFPNVTCLDLSSVKNFSQLGQKIWTNMKQLMTLHALVPKIEPTYENEGDSYDYEKEEKLKYTFPVELDACFTGYSEETCKELKQESDDKIEEILQHVLLEKPRENPSILDMKHLTTLRLKYCTRQCVSASLLHMLWTKNRIFEDVKGRISVISRVLAFERMPNLKVVVDTEITDSCC